MNVGKQNTEVMEAEDKEKKLCCWFSIYSLGFIFYLSISTLSQGGDGCGQYYLGFLVP